MSSIRWLQQAKVDVQMTNACPYSVVWRGLPVDLGHGHHDCMIECFFKPLLRHVCSHFGFWTIVVSQLSICVVIDKQLPSSQAFLWTIATMAY